MKFIPHDYQRYCTEYIKAHPVAALFLDMGLGKTVITLTAIQDLMLDTFEVNKVLIIAPLRVARDTWPAEIEKWDHLKNLDISIVVGDVKKRIAAVHHPAMIYQVEYFYYLSFQQLVITPSHWLANEVKESFLRGYNTVVIHNGIDTDMFKPSDSDFKAKYGIKDEVVLYVQFCLLYLKNATE